MEKEYLDYPGLGEVSRLTEKKFRLTTMPTPTADWNGKIVQYIGTTGPVYKQGFFYRCQNAGYDYEWKVISVEPNLGQTIQYSTMPTANQSALGNIVQYVGTTNQNYTNGLFYQCVALDTDPVTYGWQQKDVSDTSNKENTFRFTTMPTAAAEYYGKVVQYLGSTTSNYTHNYWYECKEESGTFYWENVETQDMSTKEDKFRYSTMPTATAQDVGRIVQYIGDSITNSYQKGYYYKGVNNSGAYSWQETQVQDVSGKENVFRYATMPTAGQDYNGKIVQFIGTTNANYTNGFFYKCIGTEEGGTVTYAWENVPTQDVTNKEDKFRFSTMPTASVDWLGKTVEYTGTTTEDYTHNYFYECKSDGSGGYEWQSVQVQSSSALGNVVVTDNDNLKLNVDASYEPPRVYIKMTGSVESLNFATMSDYDFKKALQMHYAGMLDLTDYWNIGDERVIHINAIEEYYPSTVATAQTACDETFRIVDFNHDNLVTPIGANDKAIITLAPVHTTNEYIGNNDTNTGDWSTHKLRTWCNESFYGALPQYIQDSIKTVAKPYVATKDASEVLYTNDKVFIPSAKEIDLGGREGAGIELEGTGYTYLVENKTTSILTRSETKRRIRTRSVDTNDTNNQAIQSKDNGMYDAVNSIVRVYCYHAYGSSGMSTVTLPMFCL